MGSWVGTWTQAVVALLIPVTIIVLDIAWHSSRIGFHRFREPVSSRPWKRIIVRILAALLIMAQEFKRFTVALHTSPLWLFWRVDWHFGKSPHFVPYMQRTNALRTMVYMALLVAGTRKIYSVDVDVCS